MKRLFISFLLILSVNQLIAQPGPGGGPQENMPIDGGLLYLIAAGISYGLYFFRKTKKTRN